MPEVNPPHIHEGDLLAAVDVGSNSFHLVVARYEHGEPRVIDRLRDSVRLAAGLDEAGNLDAAHHERAMACLSRFGQRVRGLPASRIRAVATNAVRQLSPTSRHFLQPAEQRTGTSDRSRIRSRGSATDLSWRRSRHTGFAAAPLGHRYRRRQH